MALPDNAGDDLPLAAIDLRPFLAPLLLARAEAPSKAGFMADLITRVSGAVASGGGVDRSIPETTAVEEIGAMSVSTLQYVEASRPPWAPTGPLQDLNHHLIVVACRGDHAAVATSDPALRNKLSRLLTIARPLPRALIEQAFVGDRASVMWLNGIHTPIDARPNAKTLSGSALEYALDPLGDQSFYYSAVRTRVAWPGGADALIGAAPGSGRIWLNRPKTWDDFKHALTVIFDAVATPPLSKVKFAALAQAVSDLADVDRAYAVTLAPPEMVADEELSKAEREAAQLWANEAEFGVVPNAGPSFGAMVKLKDTSLGRVDVTVRLDGETIVATPVWDPATVGDEALRADCASLLADPRWLKVYYESGHAISLGRCYQSAYRDQVFPWKFEDLSGYEVEDEKPKPYGTLKLPDVIGAPKEDGKMDDSLFAYVLATTGQKGWLACDDGSMEMADFIHIADDNTVTLIHVKAPNSNDLTRAVSVSNYEVVVGQAVKNLRHLQSKTLHDELKRGRHKQIATAVWYDGKRVGARGGMIARARFLPASYRRAVIVLQPQLTECEHDDCWKPNATRARSVRVKQLDTLMLSARLSCMAVGAEFVGVAAKGGKLKKDRGAAGDA